jgi:hypothetical protein
VDRTRNIIGVACRPEEEPAAREFFELFKTPWEFYDSRFLYPVVLSTRMDLRDVPARLLVLYGDNGSVGRDSAHPVELRRSPLKVLHAGYNLFKLTERLLTQWQPVSNALTPTLDDCIATLRHWILEAGIPVVEVPPAPAGRAFMACLTHDVDFIRISDHGFDHTLLGFLRRASVGSLRRFAKGQAPWSDVVKNWQAMVSLPAVYLGTRKDFWLEDFDRFLELERHLKATYFFIPFKGRPGEKVRRPHPTRRAAAYDVIHEAPLLKRLVDSGHEVGVHGIDAWHSAERGREELCRVASASGQSKLGTRMHWLCFDSSSPRILEQAGFQYDSTVGYNDTVGCRAGTFQAFRPPGAADILELPLHIQDTALFYPGRATANAGAWRACESLIGDATKHGGVLTILWHTRSLAPERHWGEFYTRLLGELSRNQAWFGTAAQIVAWFRKRRSVSFSKSGFTNRQVQVAMECPHDGVSTPGLVLRVHRPRTERKGSTDADFVDVPLTGETKVEIAVA